MRNLRAAVVFLTRVPVPLSEEPDPADAVPWYPLVGALVGATVGGVAAGAGHLVPPLVAASLAVLTGVLVTGAFHEDGLADVADAFAWGWTREERMKILKDPLHGSYGVAALCGSVVVRIACLASFGTASAVAFACAVAAHALGRCSALALMVSTRPAAQDGLGARASRAVSKKGVVVGVLAVLAIVAALCGWWALPFVGGAAAGATAIGWLALRKIGGVSGDVLGAAEQVTECLVLVVASGLASRYAIWWS